MRVERRLFPSETSIDDRCPAPPLTLKQTRRKRMIKAAIEFIMVRIRETRRLGNPPSRGLRRLLHSLLYQYIMLSSVRDYLQL